MQYWWNDTNGKPMYLEENLSHCHFVQRKIPHGLTCKWNWACVVRGTRTACCHTVPLRSILILSSPRPSKLSPHKNPVWLSSSATKPNPFEIILLQTTRKKKNWKRGEMLERAVITLETEQIKWSNPWCFWWWWWWLSCKYVPLASPNSPSMTWIPQYVMRSTNHEHYYTLFTASSSMHPLRRKYLPWHTILKHC